jgi:protoporphyrinogen oxidase
MPTIDTAVLGAGFTGLSAGLASGYPVFEAEAHPGGICSSYYMVPGSDEQLHSAPEDGNAYRFEYGGGHWIFGGDPGLLRFIESFTPIGRYARRSAVYFPEDGRFVPYPIQNHVAHLGEDIAERVVAELTAPSNGRTEVLADWLVHHFGPTLNELFFEPFHQLYTAGLYPRIAPQDPYKSPVNREWVINGSRRGAAPSGYNETFVYPLPGLDTLTRRIAERCDVRYGKRVTGFDPRNKELFFADGDGLRYERLISSLPLDMMMRFGGLEVDARPDPYTSVLVLNIGATRGDRCPDDHWLYIPRSTSGMHRVGFYDNVDVSFLPAPARRDESRTSLYIERAYRGGERPSDDESRAYADAVVDELRSWGFIDSVEVVDPTWIDVAYTWSWPGSTWKEQAIDALAECGIIQVGRYARWKFQGIAASIKDGLRIGSEGDRTIWLDLVEAPVAG